MGTWHFVFFRSYLVETATSLPIQSVLHNNIHLPLGTLSDGMWRHNDSFQKLFSRQENFRVIIECHQFDIREERKTKLQTDKFCFISNVWNTFIENCQMAHMPYQRFYSIQLQIYSIHPVNKPDEFGLKVWLL